MQISYLITYENKSGEQETYNTGTKDEADQIALELEESGYENIKIDRIRV